MRPAEYTPETIIQAGKELQASGRNITGFALRKQVGGGYPARLKQVWEEYLSDHDEPRQGTAAELPPEVVEVMGVLSQQLGDKLQAFAVEVTSAADKHAEIRIAEIRRNAQEARIQADRELSDAAETVDELEARLEEATRKAEELAEARAAAQAATQQQAVTLARIKERQEVLEQQLSGAARELQEQLAVVQVSRKERDVAREEAAELRGEIEALRKQLKELLATVGNRLS